MSRMSERKGEISEAIKILGELWYQFKFSSFT